MLSPHVTESGTTFYNPRSHFEPRAARRGCILRGMFGRPRINYRVGLVALLLVAVPLPLVLLSVVQYQSLVDLESKTEVALRENLRRTLDGISKSVKERLEALATESFGAIQAADVERRALERLGQQLGAIKSNHPEIEMAFLVDHCSCREKNFAIFATNEGVRRVDQDQYKRDSRLQKVMDEFKNAGLRQSPTDPPHQVLFEQSHCSFITKGEREPQLLVFFPLRQAGVRRESGVVGMVLTSEYVKKQLLPQMVGDSLRGSPDEARLMVSIIDAVDKEIYSTRGGATGYEIAVPFTPVFRHWKLGAGYRGTTTAALARRQFWQNLTLSLLALTLLGGGALLMLRVIARERRLLAAKATFVSNVSHELKTPLSLIRLFAETLEMGRVRDAEEMRDYGRIINRESSRLTQLINNILDFSRIEAGRRGYQFAETDLAAVVDEVIESYDHHLKSAGFVVEKEIEPDLPAALIDREAIGQAVLNLLDNAVKYSDGGRRIEVRLALSGERLALRITDYGIGIPGHEQGKIFEKFYRVSTGLVHNTKGSGLGLTIVRHIVDAHGGEIVVESAPGKGSRFTILLPGRSSRSRTETAAPDPVAPADGGYQIAQNPHH
jgi:signal transduction histidine kinase